MIEACKAWFDVVFLSHFEVFTEVLVTAPPICVDHTKSLVSSDLMEVGVTDIVLFAINWETSILMASIMLIIDFSNRVSP